MATFTVFVSSTFYDLKHVRGYLGAFFSTLGHDAVMFERGDIPHAGDTFDRESVSAVAAADAIICIIGGRYGTEVLNQQVSITEAEIREALNKKKLVWVFVERNVHAEFDTYRRNSTNDKINYAHVNDVKVYHFLDKLHRLPLTTLIVPFETADNITDFLRRQFSGLLHDYVVARGRAGTAAGRIIFSNALEAEKEIEERLRECLQRENAVYIRWLGMSMFNAWNVLSIALERVLPESLASKVYIQVAMLDSAWEDFQSINPRWASQADTVCRQIEDFQQKPFVRDKGYTIEVQRYAHMPCVHGLLVNEQYLIMGNCSWENGVMEAGTRPYEFFDSNDAYGRSRISLFKGWFDYCFEPKKPTVLQGKQELQSSKDSLQLDRKV
jgi:hypothetical protein